MMRFRVARGAAVGLAFAMSAAPAFAHHAMDGKTPTTFVEGLISGLAHPVIGPDHLAFVLAIGIAAALSQAGFALVAAFIAASTAGVLLHVASFGLPISEVLVAGSVVLAGALVATGSRRSGGLWLTLAALAGIVHGYAFGEAIVGADRTVVGAYLVGLAAVTCAIAATVMMAAHTYLRRPMPTELPVRVAGAAIVCTGLVMLVGSV